MWLEVLKVVVVLFIIWVAFSCLIHLLERDSEVAPQTALDKWLAAQPPPPGKTYCSSALCTHYAEYRIENIDGAWCEEHAKSQQARIDKDKRHDRIVAALPLFDGDGQEGDA